MLFKVTYKVIHEKEFNVPDIQDIYSIMSDQNGFEIISIKEEKDV